MNDVKPSALMQHRTLRVERRRRGWTQARLAKVLGVATRTVVRWESGDALPHPSHRVQLETIFGRTAEELGLLWETDENGAKRLVRAVLPPRSDRAVPKVAKQASWLDILIQRPPNPNSSLLGRAGLLMRIKEDLFNADRLSFTALYGLPGVGKTTLVATLVTDEQVQAHFPDGVLWAPLGPRPHMPSLLTRWATQLGITSSDIENPENPLAWRRALRSALDSRRILLVIDDAWTIEDARTLQIGGKQCAHLLTTCQSEVALKLAHQQAIPVPQLEEADGLALLARYVPQLIPSDPQSAPSLVQTLDCLPLALTLMGKYLALSFLNQPQYGWPLQVALAQLHSVPDHLRMCMPMTSERFLSLARIVFLSLYSAIAVCTEQLSPEALATLGALAIFPPKPHSFSEEAALVISQQPREMLDELCDSGLLECWRPGRYSLHQTVACYVRSYVNASLADNKV